VGVRGASTCKTKFHFCKHHSDVESLDLRSRRNRVEGRIFQLFFLQKKENGVTTTKLEGKRNKEKRTFGEWR